MYARTAASTKILGHPIPIDQFVEECLDKLLAGVPVKLVTFFWNSMKPNGGGDPSGALADAIHKKWGSFSAFRDAFINAAVGNFGSGWTWLVKKADGGVDIVNMGAAGTPLTTQDKALLPVDIWEHAYYIDYRNARQKFVETFLDKLVNWDGVSRNFG